MSGITKKNYPPCLIQNRFQKIFFYHFLAMHLKQIICLLQKLHVDKIRCIVSFSPQTKYQLLVLKPFVC